MCSFFFLSSSKVRYLCVLPDKGEVFVWGYGILGKGPKLSESSTPEMIPPTLFGRSEFNPSGVVSRIRCGLSHFAAVTGMRTKKTQTLHVKSASHLDLHSDASLQYSCFIAQISAFFWARRRNGRIKLAVQSLQSQVLKKRRTCPLGEQFIAESGDVVCLWRWNEKVCLVLFLSLKHWTGNIFCQVLLVRGWGCNQPTPLKLQTELFSFPKSIHCFLELSE